MSRKAHRVAATVAAALIAPLVLLAGSAIAQDPPEVSSPPERKTIAVRTIETAPRIDGLIEALWTAGDSATGFVQSQPYEKSEPTERTVVYLMRDDENLYVAFRCHSLKNPPTANYTKDEDYVSIAFDPFGSKTTGYFFQVFGSGLFWDGLIVDDGRSMDTSWEGVWDRAVRMYPDRMEVEMKIPFKTIRYKKGLSDWGLQFRRHIAVNFEDDYWTEVAQNDGDMVSRWGTALDVTPRSSGYYFEVYPESYVRNDVVQGRDSRIKPKGSLNLKWDLTSQTSLNATAYPDFAQIESDPFQVNLSRYPTRTQEQRPFFIEGSEIFRLSGFPNSGFFQPLDIFYSRRIGKSMGGDVIPILGAMKLTHKTEAWNVGALGAFTDSYRDAGLGVREPSRNFGVLRAKRRVLGNSDVGLLASGTSANGVRNVAVGADAVLRKGSNQVILQGGMSDLDGKRGWALTSGYRGYAGNVLGGKLLTMAAYEAIQDSFDVRDIGYVPWAGRQRIMLITGPSWTFRRGALRNLYIAPGFTHSREPGSPRWSTSGYFSINPNFRSRWGGNLEMNYGRTYEPRNPAEAYVGYLERSASLGLWGLVRGNNINANCYYAYAYNYARGYVAYQGQNSLSFSYSFASPVSTTLSSNLWMEWDPDNRLVAMQPTFRPRVDWRLSAYMTLSVWNEMAGYAPEARLGKTRLQADRVGLLYSWNFAPKSWVYLALNDYNQLQTDKAHPSGTMRQQYAISAFKVKYLLYF